MSVLCNIDSNKLLFITNNNNLRYSYLDSIREFSEIKIVSVVELDGVRVGPGQFSPLQSFLDGGGAVQRSRQVSGEHQEHHYLHIPLVQRPS